MKLTNKVKSVLAMSAILTAGMSLAPSKSEAGVVIMVNPSYVIETVGGAAAIATGIYMWILAGTDDSNPADVNGPAGMLFIVLGADGSMKKDQLASSLQKKYSFIENNEVFTALADLIKSKASTAVAKDGKKLVSVSRTELDNLLSSVDLTGNESLVNKMAADLK